MKKILTYVNSVIIWWRHQWHHWCHISNFLKVLFFFYKINNYCSECFFSSTKIFFSDNYQFWHVIFMAAKTIKLIISPIIQNSGKMKFTDQSKYVSIDKSSGLFGKIYIKEKQIRKVITKWQKNPKKVHKIEKDRSGL